MCVNVVQRKWLWLLSCVQSLQQSLQHLQPPWAGTAAPNGLWVVLGQEQQCPAFPLPGMEKLPGGSVEQGWVGAVAAAAQSRFPVGAHRSASAGTTSPAASGFEEICV